MEQEGLPFALALYNAPTSQDWLPRGDVEAPPWERCLAQYLRQLYDLSHSLNTVRDYRRTLLTFFTSSAQGGPPKHPEHYTREDVKISFIVPPPLLEILVRCLQLRRSIKGYRLLLLSISSRPLLLFPDLMGVRVPYCKHPAPRWGCAMGVRTVPIAPFLMKSLIVSSPLFQPIPSRDYVIALSFSSTSGRLAAVRRLLVYVGVTSSRALL